MPSASRSRYIGANPGVQSFPTVPIQIETQNYLRRFSGAPSATFSNALNEAIWRWKKLGVWSLVQDLWLLCGDNTADSLRNLISATRDAVVTGAPAFTTRKGFSGFSAADYVSLPFSTTGVSSQSGMFFAGIFDGTSTIPAVVVGSADHTFGALSYRYGTNKRALVPAQVEPSAMVLSTAGIVGAAGSSTLMTPAGNLFVSGSAYPGSITPSPLPFKSPVITRLVAYGILPACTQTQMRRFMSALQTFLDDIGAME